MGGTLAWEAIANDGAFYQAAVPMAAELPLDHFWGSSPISCPRVSTVAEEEYGGVQHSVEHRTGVFKHAGGHRTTIHVFTCPSYVEVDNEGRKKNTAPYSVDPMPQQSGLAPF